MSDDYTIITDPEPELESEIVLWGRARAALEKWKPVRGYAFTIHGPSGNYYRARLKELKDDKAVMFVFEKVEKSLESHLPIILLQALPEKYRMELVIEKATELGVSLIVPWHAGKGISLDERESEQKKAHRWPDIALKAAKQCRRAEPPTIAPFCTLQEAIEYAKNAKLKIALKEYSDISLVEAVKNKKEIKTAAIIVGPEGGFQDEETKMIISEGYTPVSLGSRILRTETAAITAVSIIQYLLGDLGR